MTQYNSSDFDIVTLDDEIRVDSLCRDILMAFYHDRLESGLDERDATLLANSADYFIRDYVIGFRQANILADGGGLVRGFAGNWYIVNTLEPSAGELAAHLRGIREFYHYLRRQGVIGDGFLAAIDRECSDLEFYGERIESFWNITGDGYYEWESRCPIRQNR